MRQPMQLSLFYSFLFLNWQPPLFLWGLVFQEEFSLPLLFWGRCWGGIFGVAVNNLFPEWVAAYPAYGQVGMGAIVSGATMAPITAIIPV